ncbi:ISL3 family transposase, partial [Lactobacillus amylovorus]
MSSLNDYIRFALDIEAHNIVFKDYFYKILNGTKYKIYEAELIQPACPFCGSV